MGDNGYRSNRQRSEGKSINGWKWAFILLVTIIAIAFFAVIRSVQPVRINEANTEMTNRPNDEVVLTTEINKEDTEVVVNTFLDERLNDENQNLTFALNEDIDITGTVQFLGFDVPFGMAMTPYVLENGNLQLRATSVDLASFSLPVSTVLSLLVNQVEWPSFIAIDSDSQMIVINLNELSAHYEVDVAVTYINLENDEIRINLYVPENLILNGIQNL
jgi:uncharacterized protein YpmS